MQNGVRILYIGSSNPHTSSMHRAEALRRIGCDVTVMDPGKTLGDNRVVTKINYLSGFRLASDRVHNWLREAIGPRSFDVIWNNQFPAVDSRCLKFLKSRCGCVVAYVNDDPTGQRDRCAWGTFRSTIPEYDAIGVVRGASESEFRLLGARRLIRLWMSYDEVAHSPVGDVSEAASSGMASSIVFAGSWMRDEGEWARDVFILRLLEAGIPVSIWGDHWGKSTVWRHLKRAWRGGALASRDYVATLQTAAASLGFLSKGNRDLHTMRSSEVPFCGGVLCAERTSEHSMMFADGVEAVLWSTVEECIEACRVLLRDPLRRDSIRRAGMQRIRELRFGNEDMCRALLHCAGYTSNQVLRQSAGTLAATRRAVEEPLDRSEGSAGRMDGRTHTGDRW